MDNEIKAEWTRRLKSGDYVQGKGTLKKDGQHCCLGVLAEVMCDRGEATQKPYVSLSSKEAQPVEFGLVDSERTGISILPIDFRERVGLSEGQQEILMEMNDGHPDADFEDSRSFTEIADWIEENI